MSVDSGVGSFNPLDDSRKDFKTNDNTPTFSGTLDTVLPEGEKISIQLVKDSVVVESGYATVDSSGKGWTWSPNAILADWTYQLKAQVVDAAGNAATSIGSVTTGVVSPATKDFVIDTKGPLDKSDPNNALRISGISISKDTAAGEIKTNDDFVTSDGGNKDASAQVNDDDKLTFTGTLSSNFTKNGGKVLVQIVDVLGAVKSSAYIEPTNTTWTYEHIGALADGQYVAKTILMDHVGNIISAKDQSFFVDDTNSKNTNSTKISTTTSDLISIFEFGDLVSSVVNGDKVDALNYTYGTFKYEDKSGEYFGGNLNLGIQNGTFFSKGTFNMTFWDQAGNQTDVVNEKDWTFNNANGVSFTSLSAGAALPKDFKGNQIIGSIGKFDVSGNFDMAGLYDGINTLDNPERAVLNHIVLSNTSDVTVTLSMGDVLALGVTNSFSIADVENARHKGQIQMRIDGQTGDKLNLDGLVNGLSLDWVGGQTSTNIPLDIGTEKYNVYTNVTLGLALFVDQQIEVKVF